MGENSAEQWAWSRKAGSEDSDLPDCNWCEMWEIQAL